jgi:hypothetical protein
MRSAAIRAVQTGPSIQHSAVHCVSAMHHAAPLPLICTRCPQCPALRSSVRPPPSPHLPPTFPPPPPIPTPTPPLTHTHTFSPCRWYGHHAVVIKESRDRAAVTRELAKALKVPPKPITDKEMAEIRHKFSWATIVPAFYEELRDALCCRPCRAAYDEGQTVDSVRRAVLPPEVYENLFGEKKEEDKKDEKQEEVEVKPKRSAVDLLGGFFKMGKQSG